MHNKMNEKFSQEEWETCIKVLQVLKDEPFNNPDNQTFKTLFSQIQKKVKKANRGQQKRVDNAEDLALLKNTAVAKEALRYETEKAPEINVAKKTLNRSVKCYACLSEFKEVHFFYHRLCPTCANENYAARSKTVDLSNRNVILTGGRVKVGYASALYFLRSKANLVLTTRFPALALAQFKEEEDYEVWKDRLTIYGLDLRNLKQVDQFVQYYTTNHSYLDILINNAAQTIKYTDESYQPLLAKEQALLLRYNEPKLIENTTPILQKETTLIGTEKWNDLQLNHFG